MSEKDSRRKSNLASFYYLAEDYGQVEENEISPSLHAISQITERYESPEFIAKGGMKQVFKVYDARCKRDVAMATLYDDAPLELCDPLIHEAWLTALLDHPNIIKIHDVGVDDNKRPYFTMDLKSGDSLRELLEKLRTSDPETSQQYPLSSLLEVFVKVCDAMEYAHSKQVLHLDLKPANIQVGQFGEVLVCDWGLGRVLKREDGIEFERLLLNPDLLGSNTLFGEVRGTPGYMSPEQLEKDSSRDKRTDIYQLGCILYSILTLQRPVEGEADVAIEKTKRGDIVPPRKRTPERNIPASLEAVAMRAMQVDPEQRYPDVESLAEEVRRYLTGFATEAEQAGALTQLALFYKRNKRLCLTAICSALVLCYGAIWSYWTLAEKERATSAALALYEAGRSERQKLTVQNAESIESAVIEMHLSGEEERPKQLLLAALRAEPNNRIYRRAMGEHFFIEQRFNEAAKYLDRGEKRQRWPDQLINDLAHEYAALKPNDDQKLTTEQLIGLLRRIKNFNGFEAMIILVDQKGRKDPNARAVIIEEHLRSLNPQWKDGWFEYDFENGYLKVGGTGLTRLSESGSVIRGLHAKTLDISGSDIVELWRETGNPIETLDIRDCDIRDPHFLERFVHLKRLITHTGQFEEDQLSFLPNWVRVIEKPISAPSGE